MENMKRAPILEKHISKRAFAAVLLAGLIIGIAAGYFWFGHSSRLKSPERHLRWVFPNEDTLPRISPPGGPPAVIPPVGPPPGQN